MHRRHPFREVREDASRVLPGVTGGTGVARRRA
jgi:hypothetical protein